MISRELIERLILNYDETADVSPGSPVDLFVITPILERLAPDPLEVDFRSFSRQLLGEHFPDLQFEEGDALSTAVAKPMQFLMRPVLDQLSIMRRNNSLKNYESMEDEEVADLLANLFWYPPVGGYASGPVRIYFTSPTTAQVGTGNTFSSKRGLHFKPSLPHSITADAMLSNKVGSRYYMEVYVTATEPGTAYNVAKDDIVSVSGMPSAIEVKNPRKFEGGLDTYSTTEAVEAAQRSITERTLTSDNGIFTYLTTTLAGIRHAYTVGFGDPEMARDILRGGSAGEAIGWGLDAEVISDDEGLSGSTIVRIMSTNMETLIAPRGLVEDPLVIQVCGEDREIVEVLDESSIRVDTPLPYGPIWPTLYTGQIDSPGPTATVTETTTSVNYANEYVAPGMALRIPSGAKEGWYKILTVGEPNEYNLILDRNLPAGSVAGIDCSVHMGLPWVIRKRELTLSDIPGGFTETPHKHDEVHIGGMADIYLAGSLDDASVSFPLSDQTPVLETLVRRDDVYVFEFPSSVNGLFGFGYQVEVLEGAAAGVYRILLTSTSFPANATVAPEIPVFAGWARCKVTSTISMELTDPLFRKCTGTDMIATLGVSIVTTVSMTGFTDWGVEVGDYLRILTGKDAGDYRITAITGSGGQTLEIDHTFVRSYGALSYEVIKKWDAIEPPVVAIDKVELLDTGGEPLDEEVPYGKIIDVRALSDFTNVGQAETITVEDVEVGLIGEPISSAPFFIHGERMHLRIGGSALIITFDSYSDPYSVEEVLACINEEVRGLCTVRDVGGVERITLYSAMQLVETVHIPSAGSTNATTILGFSIGQASSRMQHPAGSTWSNIITDRHVVQLEGDTNNYKIFRAFNNVLHAYNLSDGTRFWVPGQYNVSFGRRSVGLARCYFKNPTYFCARGPVPNIQWQQVTPTRPSYPWREELMQLTSEVNGAELSYYSDQAMNSIIVSANNGIVDGVTIESGAGITGRDDIVSFPAWEMRVGDIIELTVVPIIGTTDLSSLSSPYVDGESLVFTLSGYTHTIDFTDETTLDAIVETINKGTGVNIAFAEGNFLVLEAEEEIEIITDTYSMLGFGALPVNNEHPDMGQYVVSFIFQTSCQVENLDGSSPSFLTQANSHFKVIGRGAQKFNPTDMIKGDDGIYYVDIEVMSEGVGNIYNIPRTQLIEAEDYTCFGWYLTTENIATSYSTHEKLWIHLTPYIASMDNEYHPDSVYPMSGQNIQVTYDRSYLVGEAQEFVTGTGVRNLNLNPLAKHLLPVFIHLSVVYSGGSRPELVEESLATLITSIRPATPLTVYDISNIMSKRRAIALTNPIEIVGVTWDENRNMLIKRSKDNLTPGRRYVMYVGSIQLKQV